MDTPLIKLALVDDHSLLRSGLGELISLIPGFEVIFEADHGRDFIEKLKTNPAPDIVLLDITMPEMDGHETALWIRDNLPDTRVLVLSMMDNEVAIINMIRAGARGYILKDSKPAIFRQALEDVRDKGFYMNDLVSQRVLNHMAGQDVSGTGNSTAGLSEKEIRFLKYCCTEMTYKEIAAEMDLSPRTVEGYRDDLFRRLQVQSRVGLAMFAIRNGLFTL